MKQKYKRIGWRGVSFEVPSTWEITREEMKGKRGIFQLEDEYYPRLQVLWERVPFAKMPNIEKHFDDLTKVMMKNLKESKVVGKVKCKVAGHEGFYGRVTSKTGDEIMPVTWYCEKSERVLTFVFFYKRDEYKKMAEIMNHVISTINCHEEEPFWYFHGVTLRVPKSYDLTFYKVTTGLSYARFYNRKKDSYIIVAYNSMAEIVLKEMYENVREWYFDTLGKEIDKYFGKVSRYEESKVDICGHEALCLYKRRGLPILVKRVIRKILLWHCEQANRLYAVVLIYKDTPENEEEMRKILSSIKCH